MSRYCERPGCSTPASIAYGIDPERMVVWLDVLAPELALDRRIGVLCRRHADAMVVPLGWMLDDHREPTPRLFKVAEPDATGEITRRRRASSSRAQHSEQLELVAPVLPVTSDEMPLSDQIAELLADDTAQMHRAVLQAESDRIDAAAVDREPEPPPEPQPVPDPQPEPEVDEDWSSPEPQPHDEPKPKVAVEVEVEVEVETVEPQLWSPVFDEADDLDGLLTASSPLLSRAFGNAPGAPPRRRKGKKQS